MEAKRPEVLDKIFNLTANRDSKDEALYLEFLRSAQLAAGNPRGINVSMSWYEEDIRRNDSVQNCTLCTIFFFYAKVQSPSQKLGTFKLAPEEVEYARESLSYFELLLLCRDFRIVPRLLTKEDVLFLWKVMNAQRAKSEMDRSKLLHFRGFVDFLAKASILIYNKPGVRRMIISANGYMPSYSEQVRSIAMYMHLDDPRWVRERIQTVGATTVGKINARSEGEVNDQTKTNLRADVLATRLARLLARGDDKVDRTAIDSARTDNSRLNYEQVASVAAGLQMQETGLPSLVEGSGSPSSSPRGRSLLDEVAQRVMGKDTDDDYYLTSQENGAGLDDTIFQRPENIALSRRASTALSALAGRIGITPTQEEALLKFHPSMAASLNRYCDLNLHKKHKKRTSETADRVVESSSGFLDMGTVEEGSQCVIRLCITNQSAYDSVLSVSARGLCTSGAIKITALPKAVAPGLSKTVFVSFTATEADGGRRTSLGHIYVRSSCPHPDRAASTYQLPVDIVHECPVFVRVVRGSAHTASVGKQFPQCSENSLVQLAHHFRSKNTVMGMVPGERTAQSSMSVPYHATRRNTYRDTGKNPVIPSSPRAITSRPSARHMRARPKSAGNCRC